MASAAADQAGQLTAAAPAEDMRATVEAALEAGETTPLVSRRRQRLLLFACCAVCLTALYCAPPHAAPLHNTYTGA